MSIWDSFKGAIDKTSVGVVLTTVAIIQSASVTQVDVSHTHQNKTRFQLLIGSFVEYLLGKVIYNWY